MKGLPSISRALAGVIACVLAAGGCGAQPRPGPAPLILEREIALSGVAGRIDHLAIDTAGRRLFVAELGNGSVEAIDIASGRSLGRITGLKEPQGLGYLPEQDELAVATGGDGTLRFYRAADLRLVGSLKLGEDADDVRFDPASGRLVVGFGKALAVVDSTRRALIAAISLPAHPEGFQVQGDRVLVNLPGAGAISVVDLGRRREAAQWTNSGASFNFPLALDETAGLAAVAYRLPAKLVLRDVATGRVDQQIGTCGDADDAFFDTSRHRLYVVCGGGAVDVFDRGPSGYARSARVPSRSGARTGLFSPRLDRLFVAARAGGGHGAAILVLRPNP